MTVESFLILLRIYTIINGAIYFFPWVNSVFMSILFDKADRKSGSCGSSKAFILCTLFSQGDQQEIRYNNSGFIVRFICLLKQILWKTHFFKYRLPILTNVCGKLFFRKRCCILTCQSCNNKCVFEKLHLFINTRIFFKNLVRLSNRLFKLP